MIGLCTVQICPLKWNRLTRQYLVCPPPSRICYSPDSPVHGVHQSIYPSHGDIISLWVCFLEKKVPLKVEYYTFSFSCFDFVLISKYSRLQFHLYTSPWAGVECTTLVVIWTDCTGVVGISTTIWPWPQWPCIYFYLKKVYLYMGCLKKNGSNMWKKWFEKPLYKIIETKDCLTDIE
jgi:hypothetical protein